MKELVLYIHGKGGSAAECEHYKPLVPNCEVLGLDFRTFTPWETGAEIHAAADKLKSEYKTFMLNYRRWILRKKSRKRKAVLFYRT